MPTQRKRKLSSKQQITAVAPTKRHEPISVALPNTTEEKMKAIVSAARAIEELAKAINGTNVTVEISNNHLENTEGPCITIE